MKFGLHSVNLHTCSYPEAAARVGRAAEAAGFESLWVADHIVLPDPLTKASALQKGEVDIIDQLPLDQAPLLEKMPGVTVRKLNPVDNTGIIRPNHLHPPFNNPKVRRAAIAAFDQEAFLKAQVGVKDLYKVCPSMFTCGTPYATPVGSELD